MVLQAVRQHWPLILDYMDEPVPTGEHCEALFQIDPPRQHLDRQLGLKRAVRTHLERCFTKRELEVACIDWESGWVVNIFDHHVPLNHPFAIATNTLAGLRETGKEVPRALVVLSDSGVPLNNAFFNRGFSFDGHRIPLFTNRDRHRAVFGAGPLTSFPEPEYLHDRVDAPRLGDAITRIHDLIRSAIDQPGLVGFADQVSRINHSLWPELFTPSLRERLPTMLMAAHEDVAIHLLSEALTDKTHLFYRILCDGRTRKTVLALFDGITGCWDLDAGHGTDFFWGMDPHSGAPVRLSLAGGALVNHRSGMRVELQAEPLREALEARAIYPGMFLVYGMTHFYCGVRPLGGVSSVNYLTRMKSAWLKFFETRGDEGEADLVSQVDTRGCIGGPILAWHRRDGQTTPMSALELAARGGLDEPFIERLRTRPFGSLLKPALLEVFSDMLKDERRHGMDITPEDVAGEFGLELLA